MAEAQSYVVKEGDTIQKIALSHGFRKWESIWKYSANQSLHLKRSNPHVLHPGDVVMIPAKDDKDFDCNTEQHHVFELPVLKEKLRLRLWESRDVPMANIPYVLTIDGTEFSNNTNDEGVLEEWIPVDSEAGELKIEGCVWPIKVGHLNPVTEETADGKISGAQARLNNLGYACGDVTGTMNDKTRTAIRAFQIDEGFSQENQNGELDDETCQKLQERHGI